VWVEEESRMLNGSEFQTMGAATLKRRDAMIVQTHGTDNTAEQSIENVWGMVIQKGV